MKSKGVDHKLDEEEEEESEYESSYENYSIISYKRDSELESSESSCYNQYDDGYEDNDKEYKGYKYNKRCITEADVKPNRKEADCINKKV